MAEIIPAHEVWSYQSPNVYLVPLTETGIKSGFIHEDILVKLYFKMKEDDLFILSCPGMGEFTLHRFVSYFAMKSVILAVEKTPDGKLGKVFGFAWIAETNGTDGARNASIGYAFFREWWGTQLPREFAWLGCAWWCQELNVDVLFGTALATNRLARNFARRYGFREIGTIPRFFYRNGVLEGATLSYLERPEFLARYEKWLASLKTEEMSHGR